LTVLHDPSVATAPLEQRVAFLKSKNLTSEEIDIAIQRANSESTAPNQSIYQQPYRSQAQNHGAYTSGYWNVPPPPLPRRDWRDWFIMATVVGGIGYGAYEVVKRYVYPIIAPPTPAQLEQDKAAIDRSFEKAFAILDQLSADTEALKEAEKTRTESLDSTLLQVKSVINSFKDSSQKRDEEIRKTNEEVKSLRELIPRAIKAQEDNADVRLRDLIKEMQSLKTLVTNRINASQTAQTNGVSQHRDASVEGSTRVSNDVNSDSDSPATQGVFPDRTLRAMSSRAKIPAWQMAAVQQNNDNIANITSKATALEAS